MSRQALRQSLLQARQVWIGSPQATLDQDLLQQHLLEVLEALEPECLGLYWPLKGEFNPRPLALLLQQASACRLALPWATKADSPEGLGMQYRHWDGAEPDTVDGCGIPCPDTKPVSPDVLLVPCVGFAPGGWRLGYGGGYFDRHMEKNPHVTAVGVAWREARVEPSALQVQPHDRALSLIVTPDGVVD